MSGFRSSQAKPRAHADGALFRRRSRWVSGLFWYQSTVGAMSVVSRERRVGSFRRRLVELALRAGHRRGLVVTDEEAEVLREHLAEVGRHHERRDRAEREPFLRVHQLLLVAAVERGLLLLQPLARLLLGVLLRLRAVHPGGGAGGDALLHHVGGLAADLAELVLVDELLAGGAHDGEARRGEREHEVGARR